MPNKKAEEGSEMNLYFDYAATTPVDQRVLAKMLPFFEKRFGNASSTHQWGKVAKEAVEDARTKMAKLINAPSKQITFTSGSTEAINTVLKGIALKYISEGCHIITSQSEHKAVLDTCGYLEEIGVEVTYLPVDQHGMISLEQLSSSIQENTRLACLMWVNNETGVVTPMEEVSKLCKQKSVPLFVDATQAVGKIIVDVEATDIDILCCSAHKFYGPKGVGALYVREGVLFDPLLHGGGHERGFRSGTLNVASIVGLGEAASIAQDVMEEESQRIQQLRIVLEEQMVKDSPTIVINGAGAVRAPHISSITFKGKDGRVMMEQNPEIGISHGSACTTALIEPSHVLQAMGISEQDALGTLRFSLGRFSREEEVAKAVKRLIS